MMGKTVTTEEWVKKAKGVHGDKYNYDEVVYIKAKGKVKIFCNFHKEFFFQQAYNHTIGHGCVKCAVEEQHTHVKEAASQDFYQKAFLAHKDKYDYSKVNYKNNHTKVEIVCKQHGSFFQSPNSHTGVLPHGCPKCGVEQIISKQRKTPEQFLKDAWKVHGKEQYNYDKVDYQGALTNVTIHCNFHNIDFEQTPAIHTAVGSGCPLCGVNKTASKRRKPLLQFLEEMSNIHPQYDFSYFEYVNNLTHGKVICEEGHTFTASPGNLLRGHGCPVCWESKGERRIRHFLQEAGIKYESEKILPDCRYESYLRMDFFLPEYKCVCEFHGGQHEKPVDFAGKGKQWAQKNFILTRIRDMIKKNYCIHNGINFLEIPEKDFDKIEEILTKELNLKKEE